MPVFADCGFMGGELSIDLRTCGSAQVEARIGLNFAKGFATCWITHGYKVHAAPGDSNKQLLSVNKSSETTIWLLPQCLEQGCAEHRLGCPGSRRLVRRARGTFFALRN